MVWESTVWEAAGWEATVWQVASWGATVWEPNVWEAAGLDATRFYSLGDYRLGGDRPGCCSLGAHVNWRYTVNQVHAMGTRRATLDHIATSFIIFFNFLEIRSSKYPNSIMIELCVNPGVMSIFLFSFLDLSGSNFVDFITVIKAIHRNSIR